MHQRRGGDQAVPIRARIRKVQGGAPLGNCGIDGQYPIAKAREDMIVEPCAQQSPLSRTRYWKTPISSSCTTMADR